jgi:hypothetical protein
LSHSCVPLGTSSFDVPACLLVLTGSLTVSVGDSPLQLPDSVLQLLGSQLEHADAIGRDHALAECVLRLFFVSLA